MFLGSTVKENLRKIANKDLDQFKVQIVKTLHEAYDKLNQKKEKTQKKYKDYYDKFQKDVKFIVSDLVMVYTPTSVINSCLIGKDLMK